MSIEQRLEAVTHTLELVAHAQHDSENRLNRLTAALEETHAIVRNLSDVVDTFNRAVAATIISHEDRIDVKRRGA